MTIPVSGSVKVGTTVYPVSAPITLPSGSTTTTSDPQGVLGPYKYSGITNSNGYNTYVCNNMWGANTGTTQSVTGSSPGNWYVISNAGPVNYNGVQTYPEIQQLFNNWTGSGWGPGPNMTETPISKLTSLVSTYTENMGNTTGVYAEAAYDFWINGSKEFMIWVDTTPLRGTGGATQITTGTLSGYPFTYYEYPSAGGLPIIKLNTNTPSGTIDLLAALKWWQARGTISATDVISQIDFGWEICSTAGRAATFTISNYTITATA